MISGEEFPLNSLSWPKKSSIQKWGVKPFNAGFEACFAPSTFGAWTQYTSQIMIPGTILKKGGNVLMCGYWLPNSSAISCASDSAFFRSASEIAGRAGGVPGNTPAAPMRCAPVCFGVPGWPALIGTPALISRSGSICAAVPLLPQHHSTTAPQHTRGYSQVCGCPCDSAITANMRLAM